MLDALLVTSTTYLPWWGKHRESGDQRAKERGAKKRAWETRLDGLVDVADGLGLNEGVLAPRLHKLGERGEQAFYARARHLYILPRGQRCESRPPLPLSCTRSPRRSGEVSLDKKRAPRPSSSTTDAANTTIAAKSKESNGARRFGHP